MAFGAMLAITLALAWYFYDSVKWFEYDVERITHANSVLNGHRSLSLLMEQKLSLIEESVAQGAVGDLSQWQENIRALRAIIVKTRQAQIAGFSLQNTDNANLVLKDLDDLKNLVETIIASGERIRLTLDASDTDVARTEAELLHNQGTAELFYALMGEILVANAREASVANREAISLSNYITRALPLFMLAAAAITGLVVWFFSRSLTRSVSVLHSGVQAFTEGDLRHRIPELQEREFEHLGNAFNAMAHELADHRTSLHDSNVRLEAIVDERTRALRNSNDVLAMVDENRRKLLADISHEFRTPLTVIRGEAEIAMRGKTKTEAEYKEALTGIIEQSDLATRLVDDLLFMARADAGEPRLKVRPVSVSSLLGPVCSDFSAKAEKCKVDLQQSSYDQNSVVMGDAGRLRQVFTILIDNALQYSEPGGVVEVCLERSDQEVVVSIHDSGIGLTKEEARKAFHRFFRGGRAQEHAGGTGLGLAVAKAIVDAHQGSISLEGEPGAGAVATVILPAEDKLKAVA